MAQGKAGWLIAGLCAAIVFTSVGYGMGRKAALKSIQDSVGPTPAGSPLPTIQIEPVQPQEELAAISSPSSSVPVSTTAQTFSAAITPAGQEPAAAAGAGSSKDVQLALKAAGFDPGSTDGKMGPRTKAAIRDFQLANGLQADGKVGPRTWAKLQTYLKSGTVASAPAQKLGD